MPDFSKTPVKNETDLNNWLKFFEVPTPLVGLGYLVSRDPVIVYLFLYIRTYFIYYFFFNNVLINDNRDWTWGLSTFICSAKTIWAADTIITTQNRRLSSTRLTWTWLKTWSESTNPKWLFCLVKISVYDFIVNITNYVYHTVAIRYLVVHVITIIITSDRASRFLAHGDIANICYIIITY